MYLFSLILGVLLLPEVSGSQLVCHNCIEALCTTKLCPNQRCASMAMASYLDGTKQFEKHFRGCSPPEQCVSGSFSIGSVRTVLDVKCCNADRCNSQDVQPGGVSFAPNGKKCYYCEGQQCTKTMNCLGAEDHCISGTVSQPGVQAQFKGCVSKEICAVVDMPEFSDIIGTNIKCCQGDLCNSASSASAGLLLLVGSLLSLLLFS